MIGERLAEIQRRIGQACERSRRDPQEVRVLAVSKGHPAAAIRSAWEAGLRCFGENYVQDWRSKADDPQIQSLEGLHWHFVGALQRNKIRFLLGRVRSIETVDRLSLARELGERAEARGQAQSVLIQVNLGREPSKAGFHPEKIEREFGEILEFPGLAIEGLMSIPPPRGSAEATRQDHRDLAGLRTRLEQRWSIGLPELSMGMSGDFEVAVEEGSTEVRLGTALFGPRPPRN